MADAEAQIRSAPDVLERGETDVIAFTVEVNDPNDEVDQVRVQPSLERPGGGDVFDEVFNNPLPVGQAGEPNELPLTTQSFDASKAEEGAGREVRLEVADDAPVDTYNLNIAVLDGEGNRLDTESTEIEVVEGDGGTGGGGADLGGLLFGGGSGSGSSDGSSGSGSFDFGSFSSGGSGSGSNEGSDSGNLLDSLLGGSASDRDNEVEDESDQIFELSSSSGSQPPQTPNLQDSSSDILSDANSGEDAPLL